MNKISLTALARHHLDEARRASAGRSSETVFGGHEHALRQTLIALTAGQALSDHENPGEATLQVLHGRARLDSGSNSWEGTSGDFVVVPDAVHSVHALEDSVLLLSAVPNR